MSKKLVQKDSRELRGQKLYQENKHYRRLANVMEHPEFREFFDEYMKDWDSTKTILMFMKMYEAIEKHSDIELKPYQKIAVVEEMISDEKLRQQVCLGINNWISGSKSLSQDDMNHNDTLLSTPSIDLKGDFP